MDVLLEKAVPFLVGVTLGVVILLTKASVDRWAR